LSAAGIRCQRLRYGCWRMRRAAIIALASAATLLPAASASAMGAAAAAAVAPSSTYTVPAVAPSSSYRHESGNPINDQGSNYEYRSNITRVTPAVRGLGLQVLEFADRILLTNHTGKTVTIFGYEGEPYARVLANGTAEQNVRSPATYLNTNFYADVTVPPIADANAPPKWEVIDRTGQFEWHDHRIHWMSPIPPARVKNTTRRTLIFDWQVPIEVGTVKGAIDGQLFWTPENSKAPVAVIVIGAIIVVGGLLFVLYMRRRRSRPAAAGDAAAGGSPGAPKEAW
jgi:hypothetical protein